MDASKQMLQKREQNSHYFLRSMCQAVNGRWVECEKHEHFRLSFFCYTRRGSTCKLASKEKVENNYRSDAPERNESIAWPVMKWKVDKPVLCNSQIWIQGNESSVLSTNRKRLPIISAGLPLVPCRHTDGPGETWIFSGHEY